MPYEKPLGLASLSVPEQRRILLENDVRVQFNPSEVIVRIGNNVDETSEFRPILPDAATN